MSALQVSVGQHSRAGRKAQRVLAELERLAAAPTGGEGLLQVLRLGLLRGWQVAGAAAKHPEIQARRAGCATGWRRSRASAPTWNVTRWRGSRI